MSYSKTISNLPDFQQFSTADNTSPTTSSCSCAGGAIIGNPGSVETVWNGLIVADEFIVSNLINSEIVTIPVSVGSEYPTMCFDLNNNLVVAVEFDGNIQIHSADIAIKTNGISRFVLMDDIEALVLEGRQPKLIARKTLSDFIIQMFFVQPVQGEQYISVLNVSDIVDVAICTPTGLFYKDQTNSNGAVGVGTVYDFENTGLMTGLGVQFTDALENPSARTEIKFTANGDFYSRYEQVAPQANSKLVIIYSDSGLDHSSFFTNGTMQSDSVYIVINCLDETMDYFDTFSNQSDTGISIDIDQFFLSVYGTDISLPAWNTTLTLPALPADPSLLISLMPLIGDDLSDHSMVLATYIDALNPMIPQGSQIEIMANGSPLTFEMPFDDYTEYAIYEIMLFTVIQLGLDDSYQYHENYTNPPLYRTAEWAGIDLNDYSDFIKFPISITLNMDTASSFFKDAFNTQSGTLELHTCGGYQEGRGP